MITIELVYCHPEKILQQFLTLENDATVQDALEQSTWLPRYPEILSAPLGIFSKPVALTTGLESGDRLEIYRPLLIDPKEKRRRLAKK